MTMVEANNTYIDTIPSHLEADLSSTRGSQTQTGLRENVDTSPSSSQIYQIGTRVSYINSVKNSLWRRLCGDSYYRDVIREGTVAAVMTNEAGVTYKIDVLSLNKKTIETVYKKSDKVTLLLESNDSIGAWVDSKLEPVVTAQKAEIEYLTDEHLKQKQLINSITDQMEKQQLQYSDQILKESGNLESCLSRFLLEVAVGSESLQTNIDCVRSVFEDVYSGMKLPGVRPRECGIKISSICWLRGDRHYDIEVRNTYGASKHTVREDYTGFLEWFQKIIHESREGALTKLQEHIDEYNRLTLDDPLLMCDENSIAMYQNDMQMHLDHFYNTMEAAAYRLQGVVKNCKTVVFGNTSDY